MNYLKEKIRAWIKVKNDSSKNYKKTLKEELDDIDLLLDKGEGNSDVLNKRMYVSKLLQDLDKLESMEVAQKAKIKWAIERDENSKYYHGILNKKRSQVAIRGILVDGIWIDSPCLVKKNNVTREEIKRVVWDCGVDKSPSPDGFTFGFYRRYWSFMEKDVDEAIFYFFQYGTFLKGGNSSFISLILKMQDAKMVKDFRAITLIGNLYKIIAKILENRLVIVLGDIKKKQTFIFKVDFEKAYDSVCWNYLDGILKKISFGDRWCGWIQSCLRSSRGLVIVNGSPTREFQFHRGLKQGDPLSPLLFILIMESLHISVQRVVDTGMFRGISMGLSLKLSHLFYADDVFFMGPWSDSNIDIIVHVLECFYRALGLRINMNKSKLMGISMANVNVDQAATKIGCATLKAHFSYIGSKVGGLMSRVQSWNEIVNNLVARLSKWKMKTLSIRAD
uniref:RNA-directed DNA polymerase, eukaryota n=1 Tax=Tanacetum cinerariifolium TaxID=118510 RepID=A0A6L2J9W1_TANCI|nr:RNA-directed DNA polymerase, eukaryota [Tanacetum cinerariifolium]